MTKEKPTYEISRGLLVAAPVPPDTRTYKAFAHEKVIDLTLNALNDAGFVLDSESYKATSDQQIAIGKYTIKSVADSEMQLQIAWLNSYNKAKRLTWGIGGQVFICGNGMISADLGAFKKKHQGEIQDYSPKAITEYVKKAADVFREMQREREEMKKVEVDKTITAHILGEMFLNEDFITTTQLNIIKREIEHPTYNYNAPDNSLWSLYNHTTLAMKDLHPALYMNNHMAAHKFFVSRSGILIPNSEVIIPETGSHPQAELFDTNLTAV